VAHLSHKDSKNHKENLRVTLCFSVFVAILKCTILSRFYYNIDKAVFTSVKMLSVK